MRRFCEAELRAGLDRTLPFVATLADLAAEFNDAFTRVRRRMGVVDFNDLERLAYQLLTTPAPADRSDPVGTASATGRG